MTDTQDDCRRAFEKWYNDFPVGGRAAKEGLAWTVWQAAWSLRSSAAGDVVRVVTKAIASVFVPDGVYNIDEGMKMEQAAKAAIAAMQPAQPNVDELVRRIQLRIENNEDENEELHGLKGAFESGRSEGLDDAIALIRKWAEGKL